MKFFKTLLTLAPFLILLLDLIFGFLSHSASPQMSLCLFLMVWMVFWWIFEVLPLGVTALIPLFYLPTYNLFTIKEVGVSYSNPVIFLFLGGFIIARALEKTRLDERLALNVLKRTGKSDSGIVLGFIISTAFLSMWISNTATTVMMVPIGLSVLHFLKENLPEANEKALNSLGVALFLSVAYSANIGGVMTPIGTPPNIVFLGYLNDLYDQKIDFFKWMLMTVPVGLTLLSVMFFLLKLCFRFELSIPETFDLFLNDKIAKLGKLTQGQKVTLCVALLTALLWIFKGVIHNLLSDNFLNDTSIAIFGSVLLFLIPASKSRRPVLEKEDLNKLPWDIVLLFGGGMAMAASLEKVGLILIATDAIKVFEFSSPFFMIALVATATLVLTEIMSNVALCVVALPLIMSLGESYALSPFFVAFPATLCASFAFSMPISTPPNAIVFGTGAIKVKQMFKVGVLLNALAVLLTMSIGYSIADYLSM